MKKVLIYTAALLLWLPTLLCYVVTGKVLRVYSWLNEKWKEAWDGR